MLNIVGGLSGIFIVASFFVLALYMAHNRTRRSKILDVTDRLLTKMGLGRLIAEDDYSDLSISELFAERHLTKVARIVLLLEGLALIPYIYSVKDFFGLGVFNISIILGLFGVVSIFLVVISASNPNSKLHEFSATSYFVLLGLINLPLSLSVLDQYRILASFNLIIALLSIITFINISVQFKKLAKINGNTEMAYILLNSTWVLSYSFLMTYSAL